MNDEQQVCDCCGYPAPLGWYPAAVTATGQTGVHLCSICSQTMLSKAITYPSQCSDPALCRDVAWIANRILDEIHPYCYQRTGGQRRSEGE